MNFADTIKVKVMTYLDTYATIEDKFYRIDGSIVTDEVVEENVMVNGYDERGYPIKYDYQWYDLSKCFISFNSAAQKIRLNDGNEYVYSYYVILPLKKSIYHLIPKEDDWVHIRKADGTIDTDMQVRGFVTYKQKYLKIWL